MHVKYLRKSDDEIKKAQAEIKTEVSTAREEQRAGFDKLGEQLQVVATAQASNGAARAAEKDTSGLWGRVLYALLGLAVGAAGFGVALFAQCSPGG